MSAEGFEPEIVLKGGITNEGLVTRVGATVRRPHGPTSPSTHALLDHLERVGFDGAPRWLGVDDRGREVLSYVEGEAAIEPHPAWALTDEALVGVARLLRRYHDAVRTFDPTGLPWPRAVPPAFQDGIVSHNDPNLDNVIFAGAKPVALIDFDLAAPGSAVWDVANAARLWIPVRDARDVPAALRGRWLERLRLFVDASGLEGGDRLRMVDALPLVHEWAYDVVREAVRGGHPTFSRLWAGGMRDRAERTQRWLVEHDRELRDGLRV